MVSRDLWDEETARPHDDDSAGMFAPEVLEPTVDFLARRAGSGSALELAVGTGRVAVPLAARGVPVSGIELSPPMAEQLRRKAGAATIPVVVGDMATTRVPGRFVGELWVPPLRRLPPGQLAAPFDVSDGHLGFDTYDLVAQGCTSHHYQRDPDGSVRYGAGHFRYIWPAECDLMARIAGLTLEERFADWQGHPFTSESEGHVSVWRKPLRASDRT